MTTPTSPSTQSEQRWTTRQLLSWMSEYFEQKRVDSPRLVAEMLLAHVIGCERMRLYMEVDRPASPMELATLRDLVARAGRHEPVQYITGSAWFFTREFEVNRSTLIPRPSTETLVERVLHWRRTTFAGDAPLIADIGTGSGCIAVTLAGEMKDARVIATDIVPEALELARKNAEKHGVADRIEFREGSLYEPLRAGPPGQRFDAICANPPYVSDAEWQRLDRNVREYEPATALRGGEDGMDYIGPLIDGAADHLSEAGHLFIEIGHHQREPVLARAGQTSGLVDPLVIKDHEEYWRVLIARRAE